MDTISVEQANTLYGLFIERVRRSPELSAYRNYSSKIDDWETLSWQQTADEVARWQKALRSLGLQAGDRVALNLRNCVEWVIFDQAAMGLELVVVPLYPDDRPDNIAYILQDAGVKVLLLQNNLQWKRLKPSLHDEHDLEKVLILHADEPPTDALAVTITDFVPNESDGLHHAQTDPHTLASIIYTSGTTGRPKGVMLSHHNMLSVAHGALQYFEVYRSDLLLSFLPLSHTFERTAGYYLAIMAGATVAYSRGIPQLADDMQRLSPTIMFGVPRIYERVHARLQQKLNKQPRWQRALFKLNMNIGWAYFQYQQGRGIWRPDFLLLPILNKKIADKLHQLMGGQLRLAISGGAALPASTAKLFTGLGFKLLQGYGLTETSPVISVNQPDSNIPTSVGTPIPGVEVKIGEQNELLVKGPGNMLGYWNNHKATADIIQHDGWLRTGDQARISDTGHVFITGRIKDILVLSNGEKIPPADIEAAILDDEMFDQAIVLGEGEAYLTAILVLNQEHWFQLAERFKLDAMAEQSLNNKALHQFIIKQVRNLMHDFPAYARIRRVTLRTAPWTIENGLLTPTLKVKRPAVISLFESQIKAMYSAEQD